MKKKSQSMEDDGHLFRKCTRFSDVCPAQTHENALVYLKLRNHGCKLNVAKKFSSKNYCRVDTTRTIDGPATCKVLKVKKPLTRTLQGWSQSSPKYALEAPYCTSPDDFLCNDPQTKYFERHFNKHQERLKKDYKLDIQGLRAYFEEINSKCNFTKLSKEDLYTKLKEENNQLQNGSKWKNLEILRTSVNGRWIGEDIISTPQSPISTILSSGSCMASPINAPSKSARTVFQRRETQILPTSLSYRMNSINDNLKIPKKMDTMRTHSIPDTKTTRVPEASEREEEQYGNGDGSNQDIVKTSQTVAQNNLLEDEDFSVFQKAYEELESQTKALLQMTNDGPEEIANLEKNKSSYANSPSVQMKRILAKSNGLADEFNKINYLYYGDAKNSEIFNEDKAKFEMMIRKRKERQQLEKLIFEAIIQDQTKKETPQNSFLNTHNIQQLKYQTEEIKHILQRKIGIDFSSTLGGHQTPGSARNHRLSNNNISSTRNQSSRNSLYRSSVVGGTDIPSPLSALISLKPGVRRGSQFKYNPKLPKDNKTFSNKVKIQIN